MKRIFIVEDDALVAMEVKARLSDLGYAPCGEAMRGEQALRLIPDACPDLVLVDIHLGKEMSGLDLAERLQTLIDVPVVFLTAYSDGEILDRAAATGSFGFVVKPFDPTVLAANIELALARHAALAVTRSSEARFRALFEQAAIGVAEVESGSKRFLQVNKRFAEMLGYAPDELLARDFMSVTHEGDVDLSLQALERLRQGETEEFTFDKRYLRKDGAIVWATLTISPLPIAAGASRRHMLVARDITERKESDERLAAQQAALQHIIFGRSMDWGDAQRELRALTEVLSTALRVERVGIWEMEGDGRTLRCVGQWNSKLQHYSSGMNFSLGRHSRYWEALQTETSISVDDVLADPRTSELASSYLIPFGVTSMLDAIIFREGRPLGLLCLEHTGDRRHWHVDEATFANTVAALVGQTFLQTQLRENAARFKSLFEGAPEAIFLLSTGESAGTIREANPTAETLHGYKHGEMRGLRIQDLCRSADAELFQERLLRQVCGENLTYETENYSKDGALIPFEVRSSIVTLGEECFLLSFFRDITIRRRLETALRKSEQLAATGRMAAAIAHEINNPLNGIRNSMVLLSRAVPENHPDALFVGRIEREIARISRIIARMFTLYKPVPPSAMEFCLTTLVQDVLHFSQPKATARDVVLIANGLDAPCRVRLPEGAMSEMLYNLVKNAIEASPPGGEVRVVLEQTSDQVKISVVDQGSGIPEGLKERVFEPFFTTKSGDGDSGMGLGLATARVQVEAMHGQIWFEAREGGGTAFHVIIASAVLTSTGKD